MKELKNLMGWRPDIKVVDCTLRDGGLVNDFFFTDEFVKQLYITNIKAGVDYMEMGYKASRELFDESKFGIATAVAGGVGTLLAAFGVLNAFQGLADRLFLAFRAEARM